MAEIVTIKDVKTILTQPVGSRLVVVKIITSDDGLYGLGYTTFTQRFHAVHAAIEKHLKPFLSLLLPITVSSRMPLLSRCARMRPRWWSTRLIMP